MAAVVDIWWARGSQIATPNDATVHCRAGGYQSGLPASWRAGERARFLSSVMKTYENAGPLAVRNASWRFNVGCDRHLSLSDSGTHFACAVGQAVPVGIDLERIRPIDDPLATLRRLGLNVFADRLSLLAPSARNRAFLLLWTAFESFLKLERLEWDRGAERFATLASSWVVSDSGHVWFSQPRRSGLFFTHLGPEPAIVIGIVTPAPVETFVRHVDLQKLSRAMA